MRVYYNGDLYTDEITDEKHWDLEVCGDTNALRGKATSYPPTAVITSMPHFVRRLMNLADERIAYF